MQPRLAHPTLGRRLRIQPQVAQDLLDQRPRKDTGDDLELSPKPPAVCDGNWPRVAARFIDFIATFLTVNRYLQRQLWSGQIAKGYYRFQSQRVG